jgi:hypothetical protein
MVLGKKEGYPYFNAVSVGLGLKEGLGMGMVTTISACVSAVTLLIPQVRPAHKIPHLPLGDDSSPCGR